MTTVLRGAWVIDGTGAPARVTDVAIDDGRIVGVADVDGAQPDGDVADLDGLVLSPGFIDVHTHYDAQVLWDPDLTPSCWHGVTSVVMGNCGFGIAPTRPEHRDAIARTLENVEGMSVAALEAGIPWEFESFPEYLDVLDARPKRLNVAALLGHTPLRLFVLGEEAVDRAATRDEVEQMRTLVLEALQAGAAGLASSRSPTHAGDGGKPVPSRMSDPEEFFHLAGALKNAGRGILQITPGPGLYLDEFARLSSELGRPVSWSALLSGLKGRTRPAATLDRMTALGGEVWPQISCRPLVMQINLLDPFAFASRETFKEVLELPRERRQEVYADPAWRERARSDSSALLPLRWEQTFIDESVEHAALLGRTVADVAAERGVHPFDLLLDLSLEDHLETRFRIVLANDDEEEVGSLLRDRRTLLALSDAGAHASQLCDACYSTHLLGHWVRELGVLTLEDAVWRLTGQPAEVFRLPGRGRIEAGYYADLVAFDPATVGAGPLERVWDLPAGADRLISQSQGIEHIWVNGAPIRRGGVDVAGSRPGRLLRDAGSA